MLQSPINVQLQAYLTQHTLLFGNNDWISGIVGQIIPEPLSPGIHFGGHCCRSFRSKCDQTYKVQKVSPRQI